MAQKIIKIGSSQGITLPKDILKSANIGTGDFVNVETKNTKDGTKIILIPDRSLTPNPELSSWTKRFIKTHRKSLEALAKK